MAQPGAVRSALPRFRSFWTIRRMCSARNLPKLWSRAGTTARARASISSTKSTAASRTCTSCLWIPVWAATAIPASDRAALTRSCPSRARIGVKSLRKPQASPSSATVRRKPSADCQPPRKIWCVSATCTASWKTGSGRSSSRLARRKGFCICGMSCACLRSRCGCCRLSSSRMTLPS